MLRSSRPRDRRWGRLRPEQPRGPRPPGRHLREPPGPWVDRPFSSRLSAPPVPVLGSCYPTRFPNKLKQERSRERYIVAPLLSKSVPTSGSSTEPGPRGEAAGSARETFRVFSFPSPSWGPLSPWVSAFPIEETEEAPFIFPTEYQGFNSTEQVNKKV